MDPFFRPTVYTSSDPVGNTRLFNEGGNSPDCMAQDNDFSYHKYANSRVSTVTKTHRTIGVAGWG